MFNIASYYPIYLNSVAKIMSKELGVKIKISENFEGKSPFIIDTFLAKIRDKIKFKVITLKFLKQNK